jgi:hypothetical protein
MSIIDPNSGHFPVGEGYIYNGTLYPLHAGMTSLEVYCRALGITLPDGTIPNEGVIYQINHNLVPYDLSQSDNARDIDMNGYTIKNVGIGISPSDAATVGYLHNLYDGGVELSDIGAPGDILTISLDGTNLVGVNKKTITTKFTKLMSFLSL